MLNQIQFFFFNCIQQFYTNIFDYLNLKDLLGIGYNRLNIYFTFCFYSFLFDFFEQSVLVYFIIN